MAFSNAVPSAIVATIAVVAVASIYAVTVSIADAVAVFAFAAMVIGQLVTLIKQFEVDSHVAGIKQDVSVLHAVTNSMKDSLVKAAEEAAFLKGKEAAKKTNENPFPTA